MSFNLKPLPAEVRESPTSTYYNPKTAKELLPIILKLLAEGGPLFLEATDTSTNTLHQKVNSAWKFLVDHGKEIEELKSLDIPWNLITVSRDKYKISKVTTGVILQQKELKDIKNYPTAPRKQTRDSSVDWKADFYNWIDMESPRKHLSMSNLTLSTKDQDMISALLNDIPNVTSEVTGTSIEAKEDV